MINTVTDSWFISFRALTFSSPILLSRLAATPKLHWYFALLIWFVQIYGLSLFGLGWACFWVLLRSISACHWLHYFTFMTLRADLMFNQIHSQLSQFVTRSLQSTTICLVPFSRLNLTNLSGLAQFVLNVFKLL